MLTLHWIVFNADTESYPVYSMNSNGRELEQVVHTLRRLGWSDWPKGFDSLNLNPHSWIFYSVSVGASSLPTYLLPPQSEYLFRLHESVATELTFIWYMTTPLSRSTQCSFALFQNLCWNHSSYGWLEALSGLIFMPAQKPPVIVST